ncbi:MAG: hypothetical protein GEU98_18715 [Pseudonocardiaceae bacterium]|nr:hypothetical protein [Pseudonocardiaceae bacterium]
MVCSPGELDRLAKNARARWVDEQLWFGQLVRASTQLGMDGASLQRVRRRAHLSEEQFHRAMSWNAGKDTPRRVLPGGQQLN